MMDIEVLCINCETMIECSEITNHSEECFRPSEYVLAPGKQESLDIVDFKLEQIRNSILKCLSSQKNSKKNANDTFTYLLRQTTELISVKLLRTSNVSICFRIFQGFSNYKILNISLPALVFHERLKILSHEKFKLFEEIVAQGSHKGSHPGLEQTEGQKSGFRMKKNSYGSTDTLTSIECYNFPIGHKKYFQSFSKIGTSKTQSLTQTEIEALDIYTYRNSETFVTEEDSKKFFFSKCLKEKLNHGCDKFLSFSQLFFEAQSNCLPLDKWDDFIMRKYSEL